MGGGGGAAAGSCWERKEGHADKVVDIERMTKNPTPGFLFSNFSVGGGGKQEGRAAIIFICDTLNQPNCFKFSPTYSIGLPSYGLHKNSLRNLSKGCNF